METFYSLSDCTLYNENEGFIVVRHAMLHEQTFKIRAVDGGLDIPDFLRGVPVRVLILKIADLILVPDWDNNKAIARIIPVVRLHTACMAIGVPTDCSCK